jgi:c-di-AMP phosphodiesterase-like protein
MKTTTITNDYMNSKIKKTYTSTSEQDELQDVLDKVQDEMEHQDLHTYDIKSNDTDEMMYFIDEAVTPIVNASNLSDAKKKEIIGYMKMDVYDNKRWSIKTGVKTIRDWYKVK